MATPAHHFIQDQNASFVYTGATPGAITDIKKSDKKTVLGVRKALNDISNARKPFVNHSTKKDIPVVPIGKDPVASKAQFSKALEKGKSRNRKPLNDLTNSIKPSSSDLPHVSSRIGQKLNIIAEKEKLTRSVAMGFLHNHQECVKAQRKAMDVDYFLESVGLHDDAGPSSKRQLHASPDKGETEEGFKVKFEEITEKVFDDDLRSQHQMSGLLTDNSAICRSPKSPKSPPTYLMNWDNDDLSDIKVIESPKMLCP